jgi:hypothetical protein
LANPKNGRITVSVAAPWGYGTEAAGKFLADSADLRGLEARAPASWHDGNLQVVIGTEVIDHNSGPPRILATSFW